MNDTVITERAIFYKIFDPFRIFSLDTNPGGRINTVIIITINAITFIHL